MNKIRIRLADIARTTIPIGYEGEQNHTQVVFYCASILDEHPDAVATMVIKPGSGDPYPQTVIQGGGLVTWDVTPSNVANAGSGTFQFTFTDNDEIIKSVIGSYSVTASIVGSGEAPDPVADWVTEANAALAAIPNTINEAIDDALEEAKESGDFKGDPGEPGTKGDKGDPGDPAPASAVVPAVEDWLDENVAQETGYVLDRSLQASNAAAPADLVGDLKNEVSYVRNKIEELDGEYFTQDSIFELGNIAYSNNEIDYRDSTTRVRTKEGQSYHLPVGVVVKLSSYSGYRLYVGGSSAGSGWISADYTIPAEDDYFILIRKDPEATITSVSDMVGMLSITNADNKINDIVADNVEAITKTSIITGWVYGYRIKNNMETVDLTSPTSASAYRYMVVNCSAGDVFEINATSGTADARPWCFINSQNTVLTVAGAYDLSVSRRLITAPTNAVKLIINDNSLTGVCYKGYTNDILEQTYHGLNDATGRSYEFTQKRYYWAGGVTPGSSSEPLSMDNHNARMCTMFTLPAGKLLKIVGTINTTDSAVRVWRAYNASTGKLQAISASTSGIVSDYLRFDNDVRVYVNTLITSDYYVGIIEENSPFYDIYQNHVRKPESIMELNGKENVQYTLKTMRRPVRSQTRPFILCHFSDIHGDPLNTPRIGAFLQEISGNIDAKICTGDIVTASLDDGMDFWDNAGNTSDIMLAIGNHECATGTSPVTYGTATPQQVYEEILEDRISGWSVTQPEGASTSYLGYYYKNYSTWKIRLIVLDLNHDSSYLSAQLTWFESVLADARTNNYSVLCASHYQFGASSNPTIVDCSFSLRANQIKAESNDWYIPATFESAVDDFIDAGGEFICWIGGHSHQDYVLLNSTGKQLCITVTTANFSTENAWSFGDDYREKNHRSQDALNILGIDTYSKHISIFRIGNNLSRLMNSRNHLCLDYASRKVVWND